MNSATAKPAPHFETDPVEPHPQPSRPRSSNAAIVLASLAVGYTLYLAQDLLLPVLLAMFFALVGNPILRVLRRMYVPRFIGALLIIGAAQLMVVLDGTIVNVALPNIQRTLGFSGSGLEWIANAYALTFGGLLLLGGRAGDVLDE